MIFSFVRSMVDWPAHSDTTIRVTMPATERVHPVMDGYVHSPHDMDCNQI